MADGSRPCVERATGRTTHRSIPQLEAIRLPLEVAEGETLWAQGKRIRKCVCRGCGQKKVDMAPFLLYVPACGVSAPRKSLVNRPSEKSCGRFFTVRGRRRLPMYDVRRGRLAAPMYEVRCTIAIIARFARGGGGEDADYVRCPRYDVRFGNLASRRLAEFCGA